MFRTGVIAGLHREIQCLSGGTELNCLDKRVSGVDPDYAEVLAESLVEGGCNALLSFGTAGGISPSLQAGDLLLPSTVMDRFGNVFRTSEEWRTRIEDSLGPVKDFDSGCLLGTNKIIHTVVEKKEVSKNFSAFAVDMESHRVGKVAKKNNIPFLVIRAVADTANIDVPKSVIGIIGANGRPCYSKAFVNLILNPMDIPRLAQLSKRYKVALRSLHTIGNLIDVGYTGV